MGFFDGLLGGKTENDEFKIGDHVLVIWRGQEGWIIDKNGDSYTVSVNDGQYVDPYLAKDLKKIW